MSLIDAVQALVDPPDHLNTLLIIAKDAKGLSPADRDVIRGAAEVIQECHEMILSLQAKLIESNQKLIAVNDALLELRAREVKHPFKASMNGVAKFLIEYRNASTPCR